MLLDVHQLPAFNATLNGAAAVLLLIGLALIKSGRRRAHGWTMVLAFAVSTVFLVSYLYYHAHAGHTRYQGAGALRAVYFFILITHVILAVPVAPLALAALWQAAHGRFQRHRRLARWLYPVWLYVSVTGVAIYLMLYRF